MNNASDVGCHASGADGPASLSGEEIDPTLMRAVRDRMPSDPAVRDAADVFSLMGEPNRLRIMVALLEGELCVHDLATLTGQSDSSTSHALKLLRAHRVVSARRSGRRVFYALEDPHVRMLLDLMLAHIEHAIPVHEGAEHSDLENSDQGPSDQGSPDHDSPDQGSRVQGSSGQGSEGS